MPMKKNSKKVVIVKHIDSYISCGKVKIITPSLSFQRRVYKHHGVESFFNPMFLFIKEISVMNESWSS